MQFTDKKTKVIKMLKEKAFRSQHLMTQCINDSEVVLATGYIVRVVVDFNTFKSRIIPDLFRKTLTELYTPLDDWKDFIKSFE